MDIVVPAIGLIISLGLLLRGADLFVDGAKEIGGVFGMSAFTIGVLIVGFGTSLPEFASSLVAALQGVSDIAIANVVGSNITNILLIVGLASLIGGTIRVQQDLVRTELPVFFIATALMVFTLLDGHVDRLESCLLLGTFCAYVWYLMSDGVGKGELISKNPSIRFEAVGYLIGGLAALILGAIIGIDMIERLGRALLVPSGLISITVLAIGTSLPELFVSVRAALRHEHELALGNIFGSNVFNGLFVIGVPALITNLDADNLTMELGIPIMIVSSLILFVIGLSMRVKRFEGLMLIIFFGFFIVKLSYFL